MSISFPLPYINENFYLYVFLVRDANRNCTCGSNKKYANKFTIDNKYFHKFHEISNPVKIGLTYPHPSLLNFPIC